MLPITVTGCALSFPITMTTPPDGGPAFPFPADHTTDGNNGMSLRDWFAGQALVGCLSHPSTEVDPSLPGALVRLMKEGPYAIADAMLTARSLLPATTAPEPTHV